jgi:hypothetical protein
MAVQAAGNEVISTRESMEVARWKEQGMFAWVRIVKARRIF